MPRRKRQFHECWPRFWADDGQPFHKRDKVRLADQPSRTAGSATAKRGCTA